MRAVAISLSARPPAWRLAAFACTVLLVVATRVVADGSAVAQPVDGTADGGGAATSLSLGIAADFPGIAFNNLVPPNAVIAAGPQHLVAATNGGFAVFTKDGTLMEQMSLEEFLASVVQAGDFVTDPRILFDSGRFFLAAVSRRSTPFAAFFLLAVSASSDPTGTWNFYAFDAAVDNTTPTMNFADLPSLGVDDNAIYLTANMFDSSSLLFQGAKIRVIKKAPLLAGAPTDFVDFTNLQVGGASVFHLQAAQCLGPSLAGYIVNTLFPTKCSLTVWRVVNPPGIPPILNRADLDVGGDCGTPPNATQPDVTQSLETGGARLINAVWRNGSLWAGAAVSHDWGSGHAVSTVRVFQLGTGAFPNLTGTQDFLEGRDGVHTFYPVVAVDRVGNLALGFNESSPTEYASLLFAGQATTAPRNALLPTAVLQPGRASYVRLDSSQRNRWGDYNGIAVDPVDDTFWLVGEYAETPANRWGTWIGNLAFQSPTPTATGTSTSTRTATATRTPTQTPTQTGPTRTRTQTPTRTPTATQTATPSTTATTTETATITATASPSCTPTITPSPTDTATTTATPSHTHTATATATPTETSTPTRTPTARPTLTPTATPVVGDINLDGRVDADDLALVIRRIFRPTDPLRQRLTDVNLDQRVTAADITAVRQRMH